MIKNSFSNNQPFYMCSDFQDTRRNFTKVEKPQEVGIRGAEAAGGSVEGEQRGQRGPGYLLARRTLNSMRSWTWSQRRFLKMRGMWPRNGSGWADEPQKSGCTGVYSGLWMMCHQDFCYFWLLTFPVDQRLNLKAWKMIKRSLLFFFLIT